MPGIRHVLSRRWAVFAACLIVCAPALRAQCFGGFQFPAATISPDDTGVPTTISTVSFAGDRAAVALIAGRTYRFTSSVATDHITVSTDATSGALTFGTQPLTFTATATQTHFVHFHTNAACGAQNTARTTRVTRTYCTAGATTCGGTDESIVRVIAGGIDNFSNGCGGAGYTDFSQITTTALTGQALPITVINSNAFAGDQVRVFADWDRNFTLNDPGEEFTLTTTDNLTFTGTITPPPGTAEGIVRMRVRLTFTGAVLPCGTTQYGEVEDYSLYVAAPIPADGIYQGAAGRGDIAASTVLSAPPLARFTGGTGRGDIAGSATVAPVATAQFGGGNGRGDISASAPPASVATVNFGGGNGRGDIAATFTLTPIFNGGEGRGDVFGAALILPSNVHALGGDGRGDMGTSFLPGLPSTVHFIGGDGRGDRAASAPLTPIEAFHYGGGNGRGDIAASTPPTALAVDHFGGGNGRGEFSASFAITPIFNGGEGRGDVFGAVLLLPSNVHALGGDGRGDMATSFLPGLPATAHFIGGDGRGDRAFSAPLTPVVAFHYGGGNGRGDIAASTPPTALAVDHFGGGNGRGEFSASFAITPIFNGGEGRGDVFGAALLVPSNVYALGGDGRGDMAASILPGLPVTAHFSGGDGRGDQAASAAPSLVVVVHFAGGLGRGDIAASIIPSTQLVLLAVKCYLEGPYASATGLMADVLRTLPSFPTTEPYTALGYAFVGGGGESVAPAVLATTGNNAIVDWVLLELRDADSPTEVLHSRSALLQRDGDVVDLNGTSPVTMAIAPGNYHVAVLHRNHLGVMTALPMMLGPSTTVIDLGSAGTATNGTEARRSITGAFPTEAFWAGDVNFDGEVKYTGADNDRDPILSAIGGVIPTNIISGYHNGDVNMDGAVKYTGTDNDRDPILQNIGGAVPTNVRLDQVP